jgi:hypothetical protein
LFNLFSLKWIALRLATRDFNTLIAVFLRAALAILALVEAFLRGAKHCAGLETALPFLGPDEHL